MERYGAGLADGVAIAVDPADLDPDADLQFAGIVEAVLDHDALGVAEDAALEDAVGVGGGDELVVGLQLDFFLDGLGEALAEVSAEAVGAADGDVDSGDAGGVEGVIADVVAGTAAEANQGGKEQGA